MPSQAGKAREVAVKGDPIATPLDRERREPGISDAWSSRIGFDAKPLEDPPMSFPRLDNLAMRQFQEVIAKSECLFQPTGGAKYARICGNPDNRVQH
jgi:hypothetical protein